MSGFIHPCWHPACKTFASFGRAVSSGKREWSCREHLWPDYFKAAEAPKSRPADGRQPVTLAPSPSLAQGRLL